MYARLGKNTRLYNGEFGDMPLVFFLIMTLNSSGANKGMIVFVWLQIAPPRLIFYVWSYPTAVYLACVLYQWAVFL